jgi:hypothetical protein
MLKVRKSQKEIMVSSIVPKNARISALTSKKGVEPKNQRPFFILIRVCSKNNKLPLFIFYSTTFRG